MTSTSELLGALDQDADDELSAALFVVVDADDCDALASLGFAASLAGQPGKTSGLALGLVGTGAPIVLVGAVDPGVRQMLAEQVPEITVRALRTVQSPGLALGWAGGIATNWTEAEIAMKRRTWVTLAREALLEVPGTVGEGLDEGTPFPADLLPPALLEIVTEGAAAQGVDVGFWATPLLPILAGAVGATRCVQIKPDWCEPAVLWAAAIGPSGCGKSPPLRCLLGPMLERNAELQQRSEALRQTHEADLDARRGAKGDAGPRTAAPPTLRATIGDATMEAVAARLADNPRGLLLTADELAAWVGSFDKYRSGGDAATWLTIHNAGTILVDRKGPGSSIVPMAAVSVVGGIQPDVARSLVGSAQHRASGLAARLLLSMPRIAPTKWSERSIPPEVLAAYRHVLAGLLDLQPDEHGKPATLLLSAEAKAMFVAFYNDNAAETFLANRAGNGDEAAVLAKLRGGAARIAQVLALARAAEDGTAALLREVDASAMCAGIAIARWFADEARRIYGLWFADEASEVAATERGTLTTLANRLAGILSSGPKSTDELHAATGRGVPADRLRAALAILVGAGRASCAKAIGPRGGRPREVWTLTPGDGVAS